MEHISLFIVSLTERFSTDTPLAPSSGVDVSIFNTEPSDLVSFAAIDAGAIMVRARSIAMTSALTLFISVVPPISYF